MTSYSLKLLVYTRIPVLGTKGIVMLMVCVYVCVQYRSSPAVILDSGYNNCKTVLNSWCLMAVVEIASSFEN